MSDELRSGFYIYPLRLRMNKAQWVAGGHRGHYHSLCFMLKQTNVSAGAFFPVDKLGTSQNTAPDKVKKC